MRSLKVLLVVALIFCLIVSFSEATKSKARKEREREARQARQAQSSNAKGNGGDTGKSKKTTDATAAKASAMSETGKLAGSLFVSTVTLFSIDHFLPLTTVASSAVELVEGLTTVAGSTYSDFTKSSFAVSVSEHPTTTSILANPTVHSIRTFFPLSFIVSAAAIISVTLWVYFRYASTVTLARRFSFGVVFGLLFLSLVMANKVTESKGLLTTVFLSFFVGGFAKPNLFLHLVALAFSIFTIVRFHFYDNGSLHFDYQRSFIDRVPIKTVRTIVADAMGKKTQSENATETVTEPASSPVSGETLAAGAQ